MSRFDEWYFRKEETPAELHGLLHELGAVLPVREGLVPGAGEIRFERIAGEGLISEVEFTASGAVVRYNHLSAAGRGVSSVLAGLEGREKTPFAMLGIMLDVSRNMVFTVDGLARIFRRLALLGYNTVLLYSEDTYELPGEPYFGYQRGRYTAEEIRRADDIAHQLGIELVGCIQTLGHLGQILRWQGSYGAVRDTAQVLMVDEPGTAELVGKMLDFWSANLRSRRIHVGMDETHDLGRGSYLDRHGYTPGFELFNRQLAMVNEACLARGLKPMIWSDMYFRLGNPRQDYYDLGSVIPEEVRSKIPRNVQLVYWDYYNLDQDFYEKFIAKHRDLGFDPVMGAGVWIWSRLWHDYEHSRKANRACLAACRKMNVREVFFTMWGDDGAICHFDSAWTGLVLAAEMAFGSEDEARLARRFHAVTGGDWALNLAPAKFNRNWSPSRCGFISSMAMFWDDPLTGLAWNQLECCEAGAAEILLRDYEAIRSALAEHRTENAAGNLDYAWLLADFLAKKVAFRRDLVRAYRAGDRAALGELGERRLGEVLAAFDAFTASFRVQWLELAKPFGLDAMQRRMGGARARWEECGRRLEEFLAGERDLPELAAKPGGQPQRMVIYGDIAGAGTII